MLRETDHEENKSIDFARELIYIALKRSGILNEISNYRSRRDSHAVNKYEQLNLDTPRFQRSTIQPIISINEVSGRKVWNIPGRTQKHVRSHQSYGIDNLPKEVMSNITVNDLSKLQVFENKTHDCQEGAPQQEKN